MTKARWQIKDLIDLEYFLHLDENEPDLLQAESLAARDRDIYLKHIKPLGDKGRTLTPRLVIRTWLEHRRAVAISRPGSQASPPGDLFQETHRLLGYGLLILGLLAGAGLALPFLNYKGIEPLNVSVYLGLFVFVQVLLILLLGVMSLIRKIRKPPPGSSAIFTLLSGLLTSIMEKIRRGVLQTVTGSQRDSFEGVIGLIRGRKKVYGNIFFWPFFILAQVFGVGFNIGVLGVTVVKVLISDIAFGWQSTIQVGAQGVFELVRVIALPWSWFVPPELAHPTLAQIEGSRMVLKDGIYHLATADLVSWWPFLCLAVLVYGLLPRLILMIAGFSAQNRILSKIAFDHGACDRLLRRLESPIVKAGGRPVDDANMKASDLGGLEAPPLDQENFKPDKKLTVLIPDEIYDDCAEEELARIMSEALGYGLARKIRFGRDEESDRAAFDELAGLEQAGSASGVMILQEAWQPPIRENLRTIQDLRQALGEKARIVVGLIGRPSAGTIFTPVKDENFEAWRRRIAAMADPYLRVEKLVN